jgi:Immunity protein 26
MSGPNMSILNPSRKKMHPGDTFVMHYDKVGYLFGRVILVDLPAERAPMPGANLIYIYRERSQSPDPTGLALKKEALLIPPTFINRLPWSRGYFETVGHAPLAEDDVWGRHCFEDHMTRTRVEYRDLDGNRLEKPFEPCGTWGLHSFASLDDVISEVLGIPLALGHPLHG